MTIRHTALSLGAVAAAGAVVSVVAVTAGWACVPVATVQATPVQVAAGQEMTVTGIRFLGPNPVTLRLNAVDGPVVATIPMPPSANTLFKTTITVPLGTPPGPLVVVAMQDANPAAGVTSFGVPARDVVTVVDGEGKAPPPLEVSGAARPADLAQESVHTAGLVLVAFAVAVVALLVAGAVALLAGRTGESPTAAPSTAQIDGADDR